MSAIVFADKTIKATIPGPGVRLRFPRMNCGCCGKKETGSIKIKDGSGAVWLAFYVPGPGSLFETVRELYNENKGKPVSRMPTPGVNCNEGDRFIPTPGVNCNEEE